MRTSHVFRLAAVGIVVLAGLLILGMVPRRSLQKQLAAKADTASRALVVVAAVKAERATKPQTLLLPGTMEPVHDVALYARVPGYVHRWHADIGTRVSVGQLLAELSAPELDQNVDQARALVAEARAALALARSNYERWRLLYADSAVTAQEYQQMKVAYDSATAAVQAAEANLRSLMTMQSYKQIRAPFNGVVTARNVDNGALVSASGGSSTPLTAGGTQLTPPATMPAASLFRVAQTDTLRVYINVPEPDVRSVRPGQTTQLIIADLNDRIVAGRVVRTAHAVDLQTRTLLVEINVPNREGLLLPGMYAQMRISLKRTGAPLSVPSTALINRSNGPQVIELAANGTNTATVHMRSVVVGRDYGSTLEIVSGLDAGALVATIGTQIFTEGQAVRFTVSAAKSP
jgi:multidrug efflux pump subunit AcrA (membrane-fusion protein)